MRYCSDEKNDMNSRIDPYSFKTDQLDESSAIEVAAAGEPARVPSYTKFSSIASETLCSLS